MKTAAIICEYNPFHNGHKYHIEETRRRLSADAVIALMSGNYVQRGDAAIFEKNHRAAAAILGGADLVLELPSVYAVQSAEFFAKNAVFILNAMNCVDFLSFGTECSEPERIIDTARFLADEPISFRTRLFELHRSGISYPKARMTAVSELLGSENGNILAEPNNILAVEYCKALFSLKSTIVPFPVCRMGAGHDSDAPEENTASATYIRKLIYSGNSDEAFMYMPDFCRSVFSNLKTHSAANMEKAIIGEILKMPSERLGQISDVSEGLENRIKSFAKHTESISSLTDSVKTKRYAHSRIRRILLSAYLGITDADRQAPPRYIKILAHNEKGQELIRTAKKAASLPLVRNTSQINKLRLPAAAELWERERIFDMLYDLF